jgi:hypothetical protein
MRLTFPSETFIQTFYDRFVRRHRLDEYPMRKVLRLPSNVGIGGTDSAGVYADINGGITRYTTGEIFASHWISHKPADPTVFHSKVFLWLRINDALSPERLQSKPAAPAD